GGGEGGARPGDGAEGQGMEVAGEEGRCGAATPQPGDEARAPRREGVLFDREAARFQHAREMAPARLFLARRVDGVEAKQLAGEVEHVHGAGRVEWSSLTTTKTASASAVT